MAHKRLGLFLALLLCFAAPALAATPTQMAFQGYLTDSVGAPLSGSHSLSFALYDAATAGNVMWMDTQTLAVVQGSFSTMLGGEANPLDATIFANGALWLGVKVDDGAELTPRSVIGAVPYAVHAAYADNVLTTEQVQSLIDAGAYVKPQDLANYVTQTALSDGYYDKAAVDALLASYTSEAALAEALTTYYTMAEIDNILKNYAALNHTHAWGDLASIPAGFADGIDNDTTYTAATGMGLEVNGAALGLDSTCGNGDVLKWNDGNKAWECATDLDTPTTYTAGTGLTLDDNRFSVTQATIEGWAKGVCFDSKAELTAQLDESYAALTHTHDDRYYTEIEADAHFANVSHNHNTDYAAISHAHSGTDLTSGTISDARLSINVAMRDIDNAFSAAQTMPRANFTAVTGTAPFSVASTTLVANLNADMLDGQSGSYYTNAFNLNAGTLSTDRFSAYADLGAESKIGANAGQLAAGDHNHDARYASINSVPPVAQVPRGNTFTTVDSVSAAGYAGSDTSITIGTDGLPIISHYDRGYNNLKVAKCLDTACTTSIRTILDSEGDVGQFTSITIGADGLPIISYYDETNGDLKVAHCSDAACTTSTLVTVDNSDQVGWFSSITIGTDGLPIISYWATSSNDLKVAHCSDVACLTSTLTTIDSEGNVGAYTSIAIGVDGLPVIAYAGAGLKMAHCSNIACTASTFAVVDSALSVGSHNSITIGADGLPIVSYSDGIGEDMKVAHCSNITCTARTLTTVDSAGDVGHYTSITIGTDDLPIISYWDITNRDLKVAHCGNVSCTASTLTTVDSNGPVGREASITIGADGLPIISYSDESNGSLKVAKCGNIYCLPYWKRR